MGTEEFDSHRIIFLHLDSKSSFCKQISFRQNRLVETHENERTNAPTRCYPIFSLRFKQQPNNKYEYGSGECVCVCLWVSGCGGDKGGHGNGSGRESRSIDDDDSKVQVQKASEPRPKGTHATKREKRKIEDWGTKRSQSTNHPFNIIFIGWTCPRGRLVGGRVVVVVYNLKKRREETKKTTNSNCIGYWTNIIIVVVLYIKINTQ